MTVAPPESLDPDVRLLEAASVWCARNAEGPLPPDEQADFEAWLEQPGAREAFDRAVATWQAFEAVGASPEMIVMRGEALESVRRANRSRWRRGVLSRRGPALALAASLAVAVVAAWGWDHYVPKAYVTGIGERRVVALADGSRVSLDAATEVDVRYVGDRRQLWLKRGRANFTVAKDPLRPFSVAAADKVVVATGTQFTVELLDRQVHVVLYEGHVAVLGERGSAGRSAPTPLAPMGRAPRGATADQALTPGRELIAAIDAPAAQVVASDPVRSLSWEAGQLVFNDEPLASAVQRVNRYSDERLTVADAAAGRVLVSGVFTAGDTNAFVDGVSEVFPVRVVRTENGRAFVGAAARR